MTITDKNVNKVKGSIFFSDRLVHYVPEHSRGQCSVWNTLKITVFMITVKLC